MRFTLGTDDLTELTERQVLEGLKMYDAAVRLAHDFGCSAIGIQYQQGLKDMAPASDLAEGLLNDADRPPVRGADGGPVLYEGRPVPHFNEVDEGSAVDALVTNRVWSGLTGGRLAVHLSGTAMKVARKGRASRMLAQTTAVMA